MTHRLLELGFPVLAVSALAFAACSAAPARVSTREATNTPPAREYFPIAEHVKVNSHYLPIFAHDPVWGSPNAPITLVVFLDFECPYCRQGHPELEQVKAKYGPLQMRLVFKHFPLPSHDYGIEAAVASQVVFDVAGARAFFGYEDLLYEPERQASTFTAQALGQWATDFGVPRTRFEQLFVSREIRTKVFRDVELAQTIGVRAVPTFLVNGRALVGAVPASDFEPFIESELASRAEAKKRLIPAESFYDWRLRINWKLANNTTIISRN